MWTTDIELTSALIEKKPILLSAFFVNTDKKETKCQRQYLAATKNNAPGRFVPRCTLDGSFADVQCRGSVCYCVDEDGNEIIGTKTALASGKPTCKEPCTFNFLLLYNKTPVLQLVLLRYVMLTLTIENIVEDDNQAI